MPYEYLNEYQRPFFEWAEISIQEVKAGKWGLFMAVTQHHRGGGGTPHVNGGIAAYLFDGALGTTVRSTWDADIIGQVAMTLNIQYMRPFLAIRGVAALAEMTHREHSTVYARGEICGDDGQASMTATAIFHLFRAHVQ